MKQTWIEELRPGTDVKEKFVVRKIEVREYSGKKYLSLEFGDKSGRIGGVCWEAADEYHRTIKNGNVVTVEGNVGTYREMPQITVVAMTRVAQKDYDPLDYLPRGPHDPNLIIKEIDQIIDEVQDIHFKSLLTEVFNDGILRRQFIFSPAAKLWHHSYVGGLAEHTLNVTKLCIMVCEVYNNNDIDKDLLIAGGLLHDIGKAETYSLDNFFDYTDDGRLLGHIVIADRLISNKIARLSGFPKTKQKLIRHLVLSHQGEYEQASPVLPQTLESNILYVLDLLDSRVGGILKVMQKSRQPGQRWSGYVKLLERYLYFGDNPKED